MARSGSSSSAANPRKGSDTAAASLLGAGGCVAADRRATQQPAPSTRRAPNPRGPEGCLYEGSCSSTPLSALEDLQPDVLYHVLVHLSQQDVAHVKMCSSRLQSSILRACQHWAPQVESWLRSDPSSAGLLQQLRGIGGVPQLSSQPPAAAAAHAAAASTDAAAVGGGAPKLVVASRTFAAVAAAAAAASAAPEQPAPQALLVKPRPDQAAPSRADELSQLLACKQAQQVVEDDASSSQGPMIGALSSADRTRLDWRQVWSCLERAQQGPWQLDVRRLSPAAFPHGVLLTFELLLQAPAPPLDPAGRREHAGAGWRDTATVLSFVLEGKTVEITVDASGRVGSPQRDWCQGSITLAVGQPKLLALEVSYIFPVPAWYLHPCTLAAPKGLRHSRSCCTSSSACTMADANWDANSLGDSSSSSSSSGGGGGSADSTDSMSRAHSAALSSALSSLSFTGATRGVDRSSHRSLASTSSGSSGGGGAGSCCAGGRPRLCLDLSHGLGSYVIDPRCMDEAMRASRPRGLERLELAGRACWRPNKVQTWLGRLLPGIRGSSHHHAVSYGHSGSHGHGSSSCSHGAAAGASGRVSYAAIIGGSGGSSGGFGTAAAGHVGGSGSAVAGDSGGGKGGAWPSFAVTVSKAAVWQVPEDPEYRFCEGFMFWAVQHKAEQLLGHYGILQEQQLQLQR